MCATFISCVLLHQPNKGKHPEDDTQYADSALSAYDPYNTKMYKGVRLHDIVVSNAEVQQPKTLFSNPSLNNICICIGR